MARPSIASTVKLESGSTWTIIFLYLLTSLAIFAYERALVPLYASHPTRFLLNKIVFAVIVCTALSPKRLLVPSTNIWLFLLALVLVSSVPVTSHLVATRTARWRDPIWGPAVTHLLVIVPIVYAFTDLAMAFETGNPKRPRSNTVLSTVRTFFKKVTVAFMLTTQLKRLWSHTHLLDLVSDRQIFSLLAVALVIVWVVNLHPQRRHAILQTTQSKLVFVSSLVAISSVVVFLWSHPHLVSLPRGVTYMHPSYPLRILFVEQSLTGLIVVGEGQILQPSENDGNISTAIRYLRASHSILGGVWINDIDTSPYVAVEKENRVLGDSIYSAFVLQEAARLVNSTRKGREDAWDNALIIGLGTGISASAFMKHNLSTTVIEIDPAVYTAARRFFAMPDPGPGRVFLQDARKWVQQRQQQKQHTSSTRHELFDIVIHDCFSGGGVPQHIFTLEFWEELKSLMHEEGVIAVNYAGKIDSKPSRAILVTLEMAFGPCRVFHDSFEEITEDKYDTQFVNLVFFCTSAAARPLTFRQDVAADHLGSPLRRHVLSSLSAREINMSRIRSTGDNDEKELILTDRSNPLGKWQEDGAFEHWRLMQEVLPKVFWETY